MIDKVNVMLKFRMIKYRKKEKKKKELLKKTFVLRQKKIFIYISLPQIKMSAKKLNAN